MAVDQNAVCIFFLDMCGDHPDLGFDRLLDILLPTHEVSFASKESVVLQVVMLSKKHGKTECFLSRSCS
jgi:hypothetical protein